MTTLNITVTDLTSDDDSVNYKVEVSDTVLTLTHREHRFMVWGVLASNAWISDQDTEVEANITHSGGTLRIEDC